MSASLTKKQQKALAFRAKQKAKKSGRADGEQEDVPELDLEVDEVVDAVVIAQASKKKRRHDTKELNESEKMTGESKSTTTREKVKSRLKIAWDDDQEDEGDGGKKSKKEIKQRFILFVGNLDYKTTREDVQTHFEPAIAHLPSVRLLTAKPKTPPSSKSTTKPQTPNSRGIAFLEIPTSLELQACLKLHHSTLQGRKINVELTAGGGGKSEGRKEKIKQRNERVGGQRERRAEREKEDGGEEEGGLEVVQDGGGKKLVEEVVVGGATLRGGRRVKAKSNKTDSERPAKRLKPSDPPVSRSGWADRPPRQSAQRPQQGRRKWEPTGANAVVVG